MINHQYDPLEIGERLTAAQDPPLPVYSLVFFATYQQGETTTLGLNVTFSDAAAAEMARDILAWRLETYISVNGEPLPWSVEQAFTVEETAVILLQPLESNQRSDFRLLVRVSSQIRSPLLMGEKYVGEWNFVI